MKKDFAPALPDVIVLLDDRHPWRAGALLRADADLIGALDAEGARWRAATDQDRGLGRIVNQEG